jgi:hypothetical protein
METRRVEGYSLNYLTLNIFGFTFYSIYSTLGFFYKMQGAGTVVIADLVFAYHALFITIVLSFQACWYPRGANRLSGAAVALAVGLWLLVGVEVVLGIVHL